MKRLLTVLFALSAVSAYAADVTGTLEVYSNLDNDTEVVAPFVVPTYQIGVQNGTIVGESGQTVNLVAQSGGYKGFVGQRPFNISCTATACTDAGSTQLNVAVTPLNGGFKLEGTLNYTNISATVTGSKISVSAMGGNTDESYDLGKNSDGSYSGQGVAQAFDTFEISVNATGSLASALTQDPALFIALMVSPIVGN